MIKIVEAKRNPKRDKRVRTIPLKKFLSASGKITKVPTLDAEDPKFGLRLETVFRRNVAKALKSAKKTKASLRGLRKSR